jgi:hypothetical protein
MLPGLSRSHAFRTRTFATSSAGSSSGTSTASCGDTRKDTSTVLPTCRPAAFSPSFGSVRYHVPRAGCEAPLTGTRRRSASTRNRARQFSGSAACCHALFGDSALIASQRCRSRQSVTLGRRGRTTDIGHRLPFGDEHIGSLRHSDRWRYPDSRRLPRTIPVRPRAGRLSPKQ